MFVRRLINFFTSLRLTVVLLAFAIILVFIGTLAQVDEGLYQAQARYFRQWIVLGLDLSGRNIPILLPGGYLIGTMLLLNLVAAHVYRFQLSTKKLGIQITHAGVILLLVGQLATDMFAHESQMSFAEGQVRSYSESVNKYELAFTSTNSAGERTVALPAEWLAASGEIQNTNLPFTIRVKQFWNNSDMQFRAPMMTNGPPLAPNGIAQNFDFQPAADVKTMDDKNAPTAIIEIVTPGGSLGEWVVSDWTADGAKIEEVRDNYTPDLGPVMTGKIIANLTRPQSVIVNGTPYTFEIRPQRTYFPFSITLLKATHTIYEGTDIPKDFRSRVQLQNPQTGENREVVISMNNPLRYEGLTFYQQQMTAGDVSERAGLAPWSLLEVVHNPSWLTPYIGCGMMAAGLIVQFMFHLVGFITKKK